MHADSCCQSNFNCLEAAAWILAKLSTFANHIVLVHSDEEKHFGRLTV